MFFKKKPKEERCSFCNAKIESNFSFCPRCGTPTKKEDSKKYGLLGRNDNISQDSQNFLPKKRGFTDKIINSLVNSLMQNMDKELKNMEKEMFNDLNNTEVKTFPNGIKIKVSSTPLTSLNKNKEKKKKRKIKLPTPNKTQVEKMSKLPKKIAKTSVKRLNDKIVYEITTPGVKSAKDIFISKLESGYEIKALAPKKVYTNSIPVNLPLKAVSLIKNKLLVEFFSNSN